MAGDYRAPASGVKKKREIREVKQGRPPPPAEVPQLTPLRLVLGPLTRLAQVLLEVAGGRIKGGVVHGTTDEIGFHAAENRHYVTDVHATILTLLGLDSRRLEIPGRKRLEIDHGKPIREIMA